VLVTECASNLATAATFIPIAATLAVAGGHDGIALALAAGMAASWGFANPAGTSSNAMVYGTGWVSVREMLRAGLWVDLLGVLLIAGACWLIVPLLGFTAAT
jgi:sodium-dependent dicarboxylate transporter 2/3/5